MQTNPATRVSKPAPGQVAATIAPFAALLPLALLVPETETRVVLHRAMYTIWVSLAFATPAFTLYVLGVGGRAARYQYWRLLWTFALLAYLTHFYYVFVVMYRISASAVIQQQTAWIAIPNFAFTVWWTMDVALLWFIPERTGWIRAQRHCFQVFSFTVFITAFVFLRPGIPVYLGLIMLATVILALLFRLLNLRSSTHTVPDGS